MSSVDGIVDERRTTFRDEELRRVFDNLNDRILKLSGKFAKIKRMDKNYEKKYHNTKCTMVCSEMTGAARVTCLEDCSKRKDIEHYSVYAHRFSDDVSILDMNSGLLRTVEKFQRTTHFTDEDAGDIVEVFSMPISTELIPDEGWHHAMTVMKRDLNDFYLEKMVDNWFKRYEDYVRTKTDKLLMDKIHRHDHEGVIQNVIDKTSKKYEK